MSNMNDSLQVILDDILSEYGDINEKAVSSASEGESEEIREITSKSAIVLLEKLKLMAEDKLQAVKEIEKEFEAAVLRTWKKPLDLLDLLLYLSLEVASEFNSERGSKASKHDYVRRALVRQQAKACLVFNEIVHLLRSGFPSGAHLHWKTLHEITCVSYFVSKHGENMAKRFLDYEVVERFFQAEALLEYQQKIGYETLSEKEFEAMKKEISKIKKSYGLDFVKKINYPYGWVPRKVLKTRSLREIEKSVDLDTLRPFYDLACYNVHGGPKGLIFKPTFIKDERKSTFIPLGPSNYGLADPGKIAAISLGQVTACLLLSESTVKRLIIVEALRNLVDEISDAFHEIQDEFGRDSKTSNSQT